MTYRDYHIARKQIRKNRKSNLKLGQKVDASNHVYAVEKARDKENKRLEKSIKKQNRKPIFAFLKRNKEGK